MNARIQGIDGFYWNWIGSEFECVQLEKRLDNQQIEATQQRMTREMKRKEKNNKRKERERERERRIDRKRETK